MLYGEMLAGVRSLALGAQTYFLPTERAAAVDVGLLSFALARSTELHLRGRDDVNVASVLGPLLALAKDDRGCGGGGSEFAESGDGVGDAESGDGDGDAPSDANRCEVGGAAAQRLAVLLAAPNRPFHIVSVLTHIHADAHNNGTLHGVRPLVAQQATLERLVHALEGLQRVQATPEPFAFQKHLRFTILLWLAVLPVALVPSLMWATPAVASAIGFVIFKLEDVAVEVQNPFGFERPVTISWLVVLHAI
jgi:predicted membrane chloride channel (bestrophin family)